MRDPFLTAGVIAVAIAVLVMLSRQSRMPKMTREELQAAKTQGEPLLLLDVRSQGEFDAGHIPGATHVPHDRVLREPEQVSDNKGLRIVVCCQHGPRALLAQRALIKAGYTNVTHLVGHMSGWNSSGLPTEKTP